MNHALSFVQAARACFPPGPGPSSDHMLSELLALNEEMIVQFRLERLSVFDTAGLLTSLIRSA